MILDAYHRCSMWLDVEYYLNVPLRWRRQMTCVWGVKVIYWAGTCERSQQLELVGYTNDNWLVILVQYIEQKSSVNKRAFDRQQTHDCKSYFKFRFLFVTSVSSPARHVKDPPWLGCGTVAVGNDDFESSTVTTRDLPLLRRICGGAFGKFKVLPTLLKVA